MSSSQTQARDEIAHQIATNIAPEFAGIFSPETIERCAGKFYAALAEGARITDYLPVLTEHSVRVHLRPAAHARGFMIDGVPEVLFVCTHSLGRGQMAAALLERHAEGSARARSASTSPSAEVEPEVVTALLGMGVDLTRHVPAPLTEDVVRSADVIVTMGSGYPCPVLPAKRYLDWPVPDPRGKDLSTVSLILDHIAGRVRALLLELGLARSMASMGETSQVGSGDHSPAALGNSA